MEKKPTRLYLVVGRTGSGKSSVAKAVCKEMGMKQIASYTTRPMREKEKISADHIFITAEDVEKYRWDIAAYTKIGEYEYFTTWDMLKKADNYIYVVDPKGVHFLHSAVKALHWEDLFDFRVFYINIDKEVADTRLAKRGDAKEVSDARRHAEDWQFTHFEKRLAEGKYPDVKILDNSGAFEDTVQQMCEEIVRWDTHRNQLTAKLKEFIIGMKILLSEISGEYEALDEDESMPYECPLDELIHCIFKNVCFAEDEDLINEKKHLSDLKGG